MRTFTQCDNKLEPINPNVFNAYKGLEDMEYNAEYKKCIHDPIYFIERYVIVNGKHITLTPLQKLVLKQYYRK